MKSVACLRDLKEIDRALPPRIWENLKNARILLTGHRGFVGSWIKESFHYVNKRHSLGATLVCPDVDIRNLVGLSIEVEPHIKNNRLTHVIHGAAKTAKPYRWSAMDVSVSGTKNVLSLAEGFGAKTFLYLSSGAIYGRGCYRFVEENICKVRPDAVSDLGAICKIAGEAVCEDHRIESNMNILVARMFSFIGPGMPLDRQYAAGNFIRDGLNGEMIKVNSMGDSIRSYLYATDMTAWLWTMLLNHHDQLTFNVGSFNRVTIRQLAKTVAKQCGVKAIFREDDYARSTYLPNINRIKIGLDCKQTVDLKEAVKRTLEWHRKNK